LLRLVKIALGLEYDGSRFCGWQTQPNGCAIQNYLESALEKISGIPVSTVCAGRTDAGVHALIQVIHFESEVTRPLSAWVRGVNTWLPTSISALWARQVAPEFHARKSAIERCYRYVVLNHPIRPALYHNRVGWLHQRLDLEAMRAAAAHLVGQHDFSAFRAAECQAPSPVREMHSVNVARQGDFVICEFVANAFLQHMVRNVMGSLVDVGLGRRAPQWVKQVLEGRDRTRAAPTFSAAGLYLVGIKYDPKWELPQMGRMPLLLDEE
jgi:tRNA pseudouridine38-40 synthase